MTAKWLGFSALVAVFALAQSGMAAACACCTSTGQRFVESVKIDQYRMSVVRELRFAKATNLFVGEAEPADVKSIANPSEKYSLAVTQQKDRFVFTFRDDKKNEGTLTLALPDAISVFEVDPRDPERPGGPNGPTLYKEWRLTAPFSGTGIFKAGNGGYQRITLIVHGRGNSCSDSSQFTGWTISVYGPLGNYLFFGELEKQ